MSRQRVLMALQIAAGLAFAGLGHYYVSALRDVYPIDGFIFYALAAFVFWRVWHSISRTPDAIWDTLRSSIHAALKVVADALVVIGAALRDLLPLMPARTVVVAVVALNIVAAFFTLAVPGSILLPLIVWGVSTLIAIGWATSGLERRSQAPSGPSTQVALRAPSIVEPAEPVGQRARSLSVFSAAALLVAGQLAISSAVLAQSVDVTDSPIAESLKLDLPGDSALMLMGVVLLVAGAIVIGAATRRVALTGYVPLTAPAKQGTFQRVRFYWLIVALGALGLWLVAIKAVVDGATGWGGVLPWLIAFGLMAACWGQIDRARGVRVKIGVERSEALALGLVMIALLLVMTIRLNDVPNSLWGDEGGFFSTARDIALGRSAPDWFGLGTYAFPMAASIYQALWLSVFGANVAAWRLASVVAAWLAAIPLYFLVRATLGRRAAWLTLGTYVTLPYLLTYARMGYNVSLSIVPVVMTLALLWLAVRRDSRLYAFLAGGASGLAFMTHPSAFIGLLLAVAWLAWMLITRRVSGRAIFWHGAALTLGALIVAAPFVAYGVARAPETFLGKTVESSFNNVFYARTLFVEQQLVSTSGPFRVGDQDLFFEPAMYATLLARGGLRTLLAFHTSAIVRDHYLVGALAEPFGILLWVGLAWCLARWRRPGYAIWPAWLMIGSFVLSGMSSFPPRADLMAPVIPALAVLCALGLMVGIDLLAAIVGGVPERARTYGSIGLVVFLGAVGLRAYYFEMPDRFPPDLDNAIFWEAQSLARGSDITLIQPDNLSDDYVPWGLTEFDLGVNFHLVKPEVAASTNWPGLCPNSCVVFFTTAQRDEVLPVLAQIWGRGAVQEYPDAGGTIQFYRFTP